MESTPGAVEAREELQNCHHLIHVQIHHIPIIALTKQVHIYDAFAKMISALRSIRTLQN